MARSSFVTASLELSSRPHDGSVLLGPAPGQISDYWRTIRWDGGFWYGGFRVDGEDDLLRTWMFNYLFHQIREKVDGLIVWDGFVAEIDYVAVGPRARREGIEKPLAHRFRRSITEMYNRVKVEYIDPDTNNAGETSWFSDTKSVAEWGQRDLILRAETTAARAQDLADAQLKLSAWPTPYHVGLEVAEQSFVEVTLIGRIHTTNYKYVTTADLSTTNISSWLSDILTTDCEFVSPGSIVSIPISYKRTIGSPVTAWQQIQELLAPTDSGKLYRIDTLPGGKVSVLEASSAPVGYLSAGRLTNLSLEPLDLNPRMARPGVYRNLDGAFENSLLGSNPFLQDSRDFIIDEIEVDKAGRVVPHTTQLATDDALRLLLNA